MNSIKARSDRLVAFLARESPDVLLLQELKCEEPKFPAALLKEKGYEAAVFGQKTYNGVAILSRTPLSDIALGFGDGAADDAARFIAATVKGIRVASAYVPNGQAVGTEKFQYKLEWLRRFEAHLRKHHSPSDPLLVGGDFNVAPEDRDVFDPKALEGQILFSRPEKEALTKACAFGLHDTFRKHHEQAGMYSWWDYRMLGFPKNRGLRIDFLFATKPLWDRCTSARIDRDERKGSLPSDHAPVIAEFGVK